MTTTCTGADAVTAQAWETLAWLISPPVVASVAILLGCAAVPALLFVLAFKGQR